MADEITDNLGLTKVELGPGSGNWGTKLNANFQEIDDRFEPTAPATQTVGSGATGTAETVAKADHVHPMSSDTPSTQAFGDAAAAGVAATVARSDHKHAMPLGALAADVLAKSGGTMSGVINMGSNKITNLAVPTNPNDAVAYVTLTDNYLHKGGGTMVGNIAMGGNKVTGLAAATAAADAVRFDQLSGGQVKQGTTGSDFSSTSSTPTVITGVTVTITPASTSSRFKLTFTSLIWSTSSATTDITVGFYKNGALLKNFYYSASVPITRSTCAAIYIDSPATASAITYDVRVSVSNGTSTIRFGDGTEKTLVVDEIRV